jgi:hypothetical protein
MATVLLGNLNPVEAVPGLSVRVNDEATDSGPAVVGHTIVMIVTPDEAPLDKQLTEVRNAFSVHSTDKPVWVEGGDEFFTKAVSQTFGIPVGRPADWDAPEAAQEPAEAPAEAEPVQAAESNSQDQVN